MDIVLALSVRLSVRPSFVRPLFRVCSTSQQRLNGFQRNLMGLINTKRRWAYRRHTRVGPFITELWPFVRFALYIQCKVYVCYISQQRLNGFPRNFMGTINTKRRCAYRRRVLVGQFITELWPFVCFALCIQCKFRV